MPKPATGVTGKSAMTVMAASRIQSAAATANLGRVDAGSFASRAQSAAAANSRAPAIPLKNKQRRRAGYCRPPSNE